jgi:hypothetical protein
MRAISIAVHHGIVKHLHKPSPFQLCERWIFQQR